MGIAIQTALVHVKQLLISTLLHVHNVIRTHLPHSNHVNSYEVSAESMFRSGEIQHFWNEPKEIHYIKIMTSVSI